MLRTVPVERIAGLDDTAGLTSAVAEERATRFGRNLILDAAPRRWIDLARETLQDPMLWFLLGSSALFAVVGQRTESLILLAALLPILGMDAFLHHRTHASTEGLSSRLASRATVVRDGARQTLAATAVVPGDIVVIAAGESFPADGILLDCQQVQVDESALTGESLPVRKVPVDGPLPREDFRVDAAAWGLAGTRMLAGQSTMRVIFTGGETLYGEIVRSAAGGRQARTPLQLAVGGLVKVLIAAAALLCLALALARLRQGYGVIDALISALTLAIAALPEEFPVVLTFYLAIGVYRLARRQALVRRAVVVENIGRISCICSDKTGTMTEGRLALAHQVAAAGVTGERLLQLAAAASRREGGDPMDQAIIDKVAVPMTAETVSTFPFTEDRKRETTVLREGGRLIAVVKGAPEVVLAQCGLSPAILSDWQGQVDRFADGGHKVIACAWRPADADGGSDADEPVTGFRLAGLLCFEDPVRPGVVDALQVCRRAGIRVIMVTGDHPRTAAAVAREIGLRDGRPVVIDGDAFGSRLETGKASFLHDVDVIARAVPAQKLALVRALQAQGETVVVTGDGVNDVPALQAADIGIAMGERGTRSAREVAAIVLLDDDFSSIVGAIAEGRALFTNLQASFLYLLMIHLPLVLTAAFIPLAGFPLLYLPVHIVWLELMIHPTALLVFQDSPTADRLSPRRRDHHLRFFDRRQWCAVAVVVTFVTAAVGVSFLQPLAAGDAVAHARALALVVLTTAGAGIAAGLSRLRTGTARIVVTLTMLLCALLVQTPVMATLLHVQPLHARDWLFALAAGLLTALFATIPAWRRRPAGRSVGN